MSKESIKAKALYDHGKTLAEIADALNVPAATVRSWKKRGGWDAHYATSTPGNKRNAPQRRNAPSVEEQMHASVEANDALTDRRRAFCLHYIRTFNAAASYLKAYGGKYDVAKAEGSALLATPCIRDELARLKKIRNRTLMADAQDVVEAYMKIAFADMSDFVEWGRAEIPVMSMYGPLKDEDGNNVTKEINEVRFKESDEVDGTLIAEIKQGKDGASVKLADRMKALTWLSNYFELNPADLHRHDYDKKRLEMEAFKLQKDIECTGDDGMQDDGFTSALDRQVKDGIWSGESDDTHEEEQNDGMGKDRRAVGELPESS